MSIEPILNILCYDLRPHIDYCVEIGQKSIANVHNTLKKFLDKPTNVCDDYDRTDHGAITQGCEGTLDQDEKIQAAEAERLAKERKERRRRLTEELLEKSKYAWQTQNADSCPCDWWDLTEVQKLIFYWMAVADEIVSEEPFENFQNYYTKVFPEEYDDNRESNVLRRLRLWVKMDREQRMPFKIEACIARIASGKLDFYNEEQIRNYLNSK